MTPYSGLYLGRGVDIEERLATECLAFQLLILYIGKCFFFLEYQWFWSSSEKEFC